MDTGSEESQLNRRARSSTNPPTSRSHRTRPSIDATRLARQQQTCTKPDLSRLPSDSSASDRCSNSRDSQQQQTVTSPRATASFTRARGLSISSPFQTASPTSCTLSANEYFSPQPSSSASEARSPAFRRPPASHSSHGLETSRGPPIALISRGSYSADIARHIEGKGQGRSDFGLAQAQLLQLGLISPGGTVRKNKVEGRASAVSSRSSSLDRRDSSVEDQNRKQKMEKDDPVSSPLDGSEQEVSRDTHESRRCETETGNDTNRSSTGEDLFLNIAEDTPQAAEDEKVTRRRSRIARASQRQSLPTNTYSSSTVRPSSKVRDQSPMSVSSTEHRVRGIPQPSPSPFSARPREQEVQGLPHYSKRRLSNTESSFTPPNRLQTYRRSNLQYTSSHHDNAVQDEAVVHRANSRTFSQAEGTESVDSGPAPSTVWDELDEMKLRIKELEANRHPQSAPGPAMSSVSNDRPRTATTTVTTISSSPKHRRKANSPSEQANDLASTLNDALARCRDYLSPVVYRSLETTATEALELAAITGSSGPQGAAFPLAHMLNGPGSSDRQTRRKAYNVCQALTELCVNLCEGTVAPASPFRQLNGESRRSSMQFIAEPTHTPTFVHARSGSVEPEAVARSPSRALSRVEARRTFGPLDRSSRQVSEEPGTPSLSRFGRGGSILSSRHNSIGPYDDDEEDKTIRVPSRAMTEYAHLRPQPSTAPRSHRHSREYTSQEPLPQRRFGTRDSSSVNSSVD
ncbi:hypothetical protein EJ05DRAFT_266204 [Pseudovirgaria hyperparasitica]|uniref:Uncharacterized protein n=1 Tax=Pseudovirgaria hyperparasitica TaxID=470096 RepID=A0A6A6VU39_9PEZI|nr:uncharacterized protein EJ05DRAFT_266204 [Pseudovirgaria hyperparasitica]KAF2752761.1 hypothetical protein EJ05DRAFT_266204 [Pseudovirgaria hyperparasitica]